MHNKQRSFDTCPLDVLLCLSVHQSHWKELYLNEREAIFNVRYFHLRATKKSKTKFRYKNKHKQWNRFKHHKKKKKQQYTVKIFSVEICMAHQHRSILINLDVLPQRLLVYQQSNDNQEMTRIYSQMIPLVSSRKKKQHGQLFWKW